MALQPLTCACGCGELVAIARYPSQQKRYRRGHSERVPLEQRFWQKVDRRGDDECWPWVGATDNRGYGAIKGAGQRRPEKAHRVSWQLANGPIPIGLWVLHRCDNPPCVNPAHLFLGTAADNSHDAVAKGRQKPSGLRGSDHGNAKLQEAQVREIVARTKNGESQRTLAQAYGVSSKTIHNIQHGQAWAHISGGAR